MVCKDRGYRFKGRGPWCVEVESGTEVEAPGPEVGSMTDGENNSPVCVAPGQPLLPGHGYLFVLWLQSLQHEPALTACLPSYTPL